MQHAVTELGYVRFGVSDLAAWQHMATQLIGLEAFSEGNDKQVFLRSDINHHRIELIEDDADDLLTAGLRVAGVEEFKQVQQILGDAGVAFEVGSDALAKERYVLELLQLEDPAGNPLEIFHGPRLDTAKPFYPGRRMYGKFVTGDGGVGHMILAHDGLDKMHEFYAMLGMRGSVEYRIPLPNDNSMDILFMHCNSRDHTFAFGVPTGGKKINHLMIEVDNLDDVFYSLERVEESNLPIKTAIGKHSNDHMISFYFETPSRFQIEIGCQGRPATHQSEYFTGDIWGHRFEG